MSSWLHNSNISVYLKGLAMGAADIVPGVSGGTVAFITGIYDTLITSLQKFRPNLITFFFKHGLRNTLIHINASFLLALGLGIFTSIFSLATLISMLIETFPILMWATFFSLIVASIAHLLAQTPFSRYALLFLTLGTVFAYQLSILEITALEPNFINIFIAGSIAICAMILPGISGSFILLILGLYPFIIESIKTLNIAILANFALGCLVGLMLFSHILSWLLRNFKSFTFFFLTGLMIGSLPTLWPWKVEQINGLTKLNVSPFQYTEITGEGSQLLGVFLCTLTAISLVGYLHFYTKNQHRKSS